MVNILFTSVGRRVELLRAFRRAYEDLKISGYIIATDIDPLAPALQESDKSYIVPNNQDPNYITTLIKICEQEAVRLIFPLIDPDILILARFRKELEATGAKVVTVSKKSAEISADKWLTYKFFKSIGILTPKTWLPKQIFKNKVKYPLFIKPRFGSASRHTYKVNNEKELKFFLDYVPEPIVQEYLQGFEITNDVYCDFRTGKILGVVSRQRIEVRWGEVVKGKTIYDHTITQYCMLIAKNLNAIGPLNIQCIFNGNDYYFIEINPRFGGGAPLGFAAGVNAPLWFLALAAGIPIQIPPIGSYKVNLYFTRFDDAFYLNEEDLKHVEGNHI